MSNQTVERLIFQLGTNNWQSVEEFAPGSGILHEQLHETFNTIAGVESYSVFPSRIQRFSRPDARVFELDHDIPICESVSPVSSYRWHSMSEDEFSAYRKRLAEFVYSYINEVETRLNRSFDVFIAHHAFLNPLVMHDVNDMRAVEGKPVVPVYAFVHGTSLLMFNHEITGGNPEYPPRFYPAWIEQGVFDKVEAVFVISEAQQDQFLAVFDSFDPAKVFLTPNGIDPRVFNRDPGLTADSVLTGFDTVPYEGSNSASQQLPTGFDRIVLFVGKFADIKRLDCLLKAAQTYEQVAAANGLSVATLVAGSGPHDSVKLYQDMAIDLGIEHAYFVGPRQQADLARLYNVADLGVFPSKNEAFGLVFLECLACGTPVVGTASGGPLEFVDSPVGELVFDHDSNADFADDLGKTISRALVEDWKTAKSTAAIERASHYTLEKQCLLMLSGIDSLS